MKLGGTFEQNLAHLPRPRRQALLQQIANALVRIGQQLLDVALAFERALLDLVAGVQQAPAGGEAAHDPRVGTEVSGGWHPAGEFIDEGRAAGLVEHALLCQLGAHGQGVNRLAPLSEREHGRVDELVLRAVEVLGAQTFLKHDRFERLGAGEQDCAEDAALGLEVVRGDGGDRLHGGHDPAGGRGRSTRWSDLGSVRR